MDFNRLYELSKQAAKLEEFLIGLRAGRAVSSICANVGSGLSFSEFSIFLRDDIKRTIDLTLLRELERLKEEIRVATLDKEEE